MSSYSNNNSNSNASNKNNLHIKLAPLPLHPHILIPHNGSWILNPGEAWRRSSFSPARAKYVRLRRIHFNLIKFWTFSRKSCSFAATALSSLALWLWLWLASTLLQMEMDIWMGWWHGIVWVAAIPQLDSSCSKDCRRVATNAAFAFSCCLFAFLCLRVCVLNSIFYSFFLLSLFSFLFFFLTTFCCIS